MNRQFLKINDNKNEIMVFGNKKVLNSLHLNRTFLDSGVCIRFSDNVKHLGVWLDKSLFFDLNITKLSSICYASIRNIRSVWKLLTQEPTESLVHSPITCHIDVCLFFGTSKSNLHKLHVIQNTAIRVIFNLKKHDYVTSHLKSLHWLNIEEMIYFKLLITIFKYIHDLAPILLTNLITFKDVDTLTLEPKLYFSSSTFVTVPLHTTLLDFGMRYPSRFTLFLPWTPLKLH